MSKKKCLVVLEVSQKQKYIFETNRLNENIGASIVVREITNKALVDAIKSFYNPETRGQYPSDLTLSEGYNGKTEEYMDKILINDGGGKSVFQFETEREADAFIKITSLYLLRHYYGAEPYYAKLSYSEEESEADMPELIDKLYKELNKQKGRRLESFQFIGLGLAKKCPSTSLPANKIDKELGYSKELIQVAEESQRKSNQSYNLSAYVKLEAAKRQDREFFHMLYGEENEYNYQENDIRFPHRFDELGCSEGKKNMIAIICIDGNKMGNKVRKIAENFHQFESSNYKNRTYRQVIREFSKFIQKVYTKAQKEVVESIKNNREHLKTFLNIEKLDQNIIPIRPLILAGDDVCFVTDARIGLDAARMMLQKINEISRIEYRTLVETYPKYFDGVLSDGMLYASAGIVFCGQKYPFSKAHELAESLVSNAKKNIPEESDALMIDYQIVMGEAESDIKKERNKQQFDRTLRSKNIKPYCLGKKLSGITAFSEFDDAFEKLKKLTSGKNDDKVKVGRGKIKELAYYIQQGDALVKNYIHCSKDLSKYLTEVHGSYAIYLDAIEMLDLHHVIIEPKEQEG